MGYAENEGCISPRLLTYGRAELEAASFYVSKQIGKNGGEG